MCRLDAEIKSYTDGKTIIIYHVSTAANIAAMCAIVPIMIAQYTFQ